RGPEYLLRFAYASTDLDYRNVDQHTIAADLIDQWQALDWGHMGIDTSGVVPSGQTRTRFYPRGDNVFQRLVELGEVRGGFDWWIDSARALQLAGQKGDDRTGQVTLDRRNVTSPNLHVSLAAGSIASVALALNTDDENPLAAEEENPDLLASAGRLGWVESFDGVTEQGTLDDYAERLLGDRDGPLVGAQPEAIPVAGADAMSFEAGDRVEMAFDPGVGLVVVRRRVLAKRGTVSEDGNETDGVEVGRHVGASSKIPPRRSRTFAAAGRSTRSRATPTRSPTCSPEASSATLSERRASRASPAALSTCPTSPSRSRSRPAASSASSDTSAAGAAR